MSSSVFTCSICKKPMRKEESRPINDVKGKVMGRTCQACRNTTVRLRCSASKCTTPLYKLKHLKSLPKPAHALSPEAKKTFLENEFGSVALISSLRCCACYVRLHRLSSSVSKSVPRPHLQTILFKIKLVAPQYHTSWHQSELSGFLTNLKPVQGKKWLNLKQKLKTWVPHMNRSARKFLKANLMGYR